MPHEILLGRSHALSGGLRVRLRLAQSRDLRAIQALLGPDGEQLEAARLVRFDPRRRAVTCAMALIDGVETIVGIGAIDIEADTPDTVLVDGPVRDGLRELLTRALRSRIAAISERQAA